jgi:hypothetical protein
MLGAHAMIPLDSVLMRRHVKPGSALTTTPIAPVLPRVLDANAERRSGYDPSASSTQG